MAPSGSSPNPSLLNLIRVGRGLLPNQHLTNIVGTCTPLNFILFLFLSAVIFILFIFFLGIESE